MCCLVLPQESAEPYQQEGLYHMHPLDLVPPCLQNPELNKPILFINSQFMAFSYSNRKQTSIINFQV